MMALVGICPPSRRSTRARTLRFSVASRPLREGLKHQHALLDILARGRLTRDFEYARERQEGVCDTFDPPGAMVAEKNTSDG